MTVTVAETVGFAAPAFVGTMTTVMPWYAGLPALLEAGAVEGAILGWAQAAMLRDALPGLRVLRWVMLTVGARSACSSSSSPRCGTRGSGSGSPS